MNKAENFTANLVHIARYDTQSDLEIALEEKRRDWEAFMENSKINATVNPLIAQSWIRSKSAGIDPYRISTTQLSDIEFQKLRERNKILLEYAKPLMDELAEIGAGYISLMSLHDRDGYMLELNDRQRPELAWRDECFKPGVRWREEDVGTNGLGLVLIEKKPIQIIGQEHYCYGQKDICCCAAPIMDAEGAVVGVLNVCAQSGNFSSHMMTLVVLSSYAISNQLKAYHDYEVDNTVLKVISESLVILDKRMNIIRCSEQAAAIFHVSPETLLGYHIQDVIHIPELEQHLQEGGENFICRECSSYFNGRSILCDVSVTPVRRDGDIMAIALAIKSNPMIAREIASKVGNCAHFSFADIISRDERLQTLTEEMKASANQAAPILICGESGTGKEVFAHAIHDYSERCEEPFVTINCASSPRKILGIDLFGCEKNVYSGSLRNGSLGKLELSDGGTVFMDEIGKLSLELQKELVQVLTTHRLRRIGGKTERKIDVHLIAATHLNLAEAVEKKLFSPKLYNLLWENVFNIPPLRERRQDIGLLAQNMLDQLNEGEGTHKVISDELMERLEELPWPGNSRELEDVVISAYYCCDSDLIQIRHMEEQLREAECGQCVGERSGELRWNAGISERDYLIENLRGNNLDVGRTAESLHISRATLYRKMKKWEIRCRDIR